MLQEKTSKNYLKSNMFNILYISLIFSFVTVVVAQDKQMKQYQPPKQIVNEPLAPANSGLVVSADEDYLIGPSDIIEIKIEDAPELSGTFRLNAKGEFTLPIIGLVTAKKKTTEDVMSVITNKLRGNYLMNPIVSVTVKQSNSRAFFIQGAVRRPGIYQIEGRPSLLKLITIAGGLADNYGSTAFIMREKKPDSESANPEEAEVNSKTASPETKDSTTSEKSALTKEVTVTEKSPQYELIKANINNLLRGNLGQNITIELGDIVHIPQSDVFFVAGEVKAPGSFPLKEGTTLRQAISLAQGTNFEGKLDQSVIFREDLQTGQRQEIKIDVAAIMAGKKDDVAIFANDIIIVPNSKVKTISKSLLKSLTGGLPRLLFGL